MKLQDQLIHLRLMKLKALKAMQINVEDPTVLKSGRSAVDLFVEIGKINQLEAKMIKAINEENQKLCHGCYKENCPCSLRINAPMIENNGKTYLKCWRKNEEI